MLLSDRREKELSKLEARLTAENLALQADRESLRQAQGKAERAEAAAREAATALDMERAHAQELLRSASRSDAFFTAGQQQAPANNRTSVASESRREYSLTGLVGEESPSVKYSVLSVSDNGNFASGRLESMARAETEARNEGRRLQLRLAEQEVELRRGRRSSGVGVLNSSGSAMLTSDPWE